MVTRSRASQQKSCGCVGVGKQSLVRFKGLGVTRSRATKNNVCVEGGGGRDRGAGAVSPHCSRHQPTIPAPGKTPWSIGSFVCPSVSKGQGVRGIRPHNDKIQDAPRSRRSPKQLRQQDSTRFSLPQERKTIGQEKRLRATPENGRPTEERHG